MVATIDVEDMALVGRYLWHAALGDGGWYARSKDEQGKPFRLHQLIFGAARPDHKNGNGLDNRRSNLRAATSTQNLANTRLRRNNRSGFKGVSRTESGRWVARLNIAGRTFRLGKFDTPEAAARAYDAKAREVFGEFARTNFDDLGEP